MFQQNVGSSRKTLYIFLAVIVAWGANWPITKIALSYMPPLYFALARMLIGAVAMFVLLIAKRQLTIPKRQDCKILLSEAILHMAAPIALMNLALEHVPAGRSAVLSFTTPLWIAPAGIFLLGERVSSGKLAGLILGLFGLIVMFNPFGFDWSSREALLGNGLLIWPR